MFNKTEKTEKTERPGTFFRFEDLRIYHKSLDYINWLQDVSMLYPENDKTGLTSRFNESARNIALYIAEGSARNKSQFIYYLKMAKSAIRECLVYTTVSYKGNLITETYEEESRGQLMEMTKMLGALITSLQRSAANGGHGNGNGHDHPHTHGNGRPKFEEMHPSLNTPNEIDLDI